ncbi:glycolate oxidase iron-sulfur subunit [Desulfosarcina ovata subsp. sediminis]|uniref:Glycolate oxidase iron-sulfur subunit n=1 Tax=Desulfosarcina ovata subsp. sediminis TaxID=885957 RepID=A0A5K7ZVQ4_9BACT|nr:(Fe-S)-binding protein [Desulfosarcina ovata]BBO84333.1 glycolate oxidase iron-sulfur subunit [Desulfosarcina ovata subsp. sediminis]
MEVLARLMRELEDQLGACMRCGMCHSVCPLFEQTGRETDVARGKLALLSGLMERMFDDPQGVSRRIDKCLLCGSCTASCPSGVHAQEIFLKARAVLGGYMGLSPANRVILRGMLSHPALFDRLAEWAARFQALFTRPANDVLNTSCVRAMSPWFQDRHFQLLAAEPFHRQVPFLDRPAGKSGLKVALFTGCLIDKIFPHVARSVVRVLEHLGVGIYLPENQGCCGIPALSSGDMQTFEKLLAHNLRRFSTGAFDVLVTACATCTSTIHKVWPQMAGRRYRQEALQLADRTMDISQFLVRESGLPALPESSAAPRMVTYHDPCHLKKGLNVFKEPRAVINAAPGYRLKEMAEPDRCCGMGGCFNLKYYGLSREIGRKKAAQIMNTRADVLVTGCPACMIQMADMLSQAGSGIAIRHPLELCAEALDD